MFNQSAQISKLFMISVQSHVYNHTKGNLNSPVNLMCLFFSGLRKETNSWKKANARTWKIKCRTSFYEMTVLITALPCPLLEKIRKWAISSI